MLKLIKRDVTPPNGYFFRDYDTGYLTKASFLDQLFARARQHRTANGLEIPENFNEIVENWLCMNMPAGVCQEIVDGRIMPRSKVTTVNTYEVIRRTEAIHQLFKRGGRRYADTREADRRARICVDCAFNKGMSGCTGCRGIDHILSDKVSGRLTSVDDRLRVCARSGIHNRVLVHLDEATIEKTNGTRSFPPECWRVRNKETDQ
jgi:hypothetical protein